MWRQGAEVAENMKIEVAEWDTEAHCSAGCFYLCPEGQADSPRTVDLSSHTLKCSLLLHAFQILPFCRLYSVFCPMETLSEQSPTYFCWNFFCFMTSLTFVSHLSLPRIPICEIIEQHQTCPMIFGSISSLHFLKGPKSFELDWVPIFFYDWILFFGCKITPQYLGILECQQHLSLT